MILELNERLTGIRDTMRQRERLEAQLNAAHEKLRAERMRRDALTAVLAKEQSDVERLEGMSLAGVFYSVLGEKEMQLKKEREEFLRAKLQQDQCLHAVAALEAEVGALRARLEALGDVKGQYQELLAEKEQLLLSASDATTAKIVSLTDRLNDLRATQKEVEEAIGAGTELQGGLDGVVEKLQSAKGWGTWDMIGGGILATAIKHSRIDEARTLMHDVQTLLGRFQRELADVAVESVPAADITEFDRFADYFLDGLIWDWIVQSKIQRSLEHVLAVRDRVAEIVSGLQAQLSELMGKAEAVAQERQQAVEGAWA